MCHGFRGEHAIDHGEDLGEVVLRSSGGLLDVRVDQEGGVVGFVVFQEGDDPQIPVLTAETGEERIGLRRCSSEYQKSEVQRDLRQKDARVLKGVGWKGLVARAVECSSQPEGKLQVVIDDENRRIHVGQNLAI